ncbi:MAG: dipeptide ABC transporter ATP-binding protein [Calditrichia bacterium]
MINPLLNIQNLSVLLSRAEPPLYLVKDINMTINANEIVGLVGESGSGKSITAFSILNLLDSGLKRRAEAIFYKDTDLMQKSEAELRALRGNEISMIFQDPMSALNPLLKIGKQLDEVISVHQPLDKEERKLKIIEVLRELDFPDPEIRLHQYPHELSGGLRQRILIAMALLNMPDLVIADEPTTALDVTTQAKSLELLLRMREKYEAAFLIISHDLYLLSKISDRIYVMYAGEIIEEGKAIDIFTNPLHPYTRGLIDAIPIPGEFRQVTSIPGTLPNPGSRPTGCIFSDRCSYTKENCRKEKPDYQTDSDRQVKCFYPLG